MQWKHVDCSPPKKFRTQPAAGKSYDNNFGDSKELHMVDYLPSKKTIIGQYCVEIKLCLNCIMPPVRNVGGNCDWVFGFFMTMRQFTGHLLHSNLFATMDFFN